MLVGTIVCKTGNVTSDGKAGFTYNFEGIDISSCLYGRLSTNSYDAINFMAGSTDDADAIWSRQFNVNLSSVKVQINTSRNADGKLIKGQANYDMFCKLGALIRYAKRKCSKENAKFYTGMTSASGEYTPETTTSYNIFMDNGALIGEVTLRLGEIMSMDLETFDFVINIKDDTTVETTMFPDIKNSTPKGFKFDEETLGYEVKPVVYGKANTDGMYTTLDEIIKNNPDKEFDWLLDKQYVIVDDSMLDSIVEMFESVPDDKPIFYDTETTGLSITFKSRIGQGDQCVGIILSVEDGESYFFPMQMRSIPNLCNGDHFYFMEKYMRHILETKRLVVHNLAFDWKVSYIYDINANITDDTMAMISLTLAEEKENFPIGLKALTKLLLHRDALELDDMVASDSWGESDIRFWDLPYELTRLYACADTDDTRGIYMYVMQNDLLHKYNATRVYEIEIAFSYAVGYQEFYGHKVDVDNLPILKESLDKGLKENYAKMVELVGYEFNPNSSKQLLQIMYTDLGIPEQISRKSGRPTTDKETLKALSETTDIEGNPKYPFVRYLKDYRTFEGVRKIVDKFPELASEDGYLFSHVMQYGTTTGRVSINTPNYQSYNDPVKKHIVPRPGYFMTDTDYSSVEYRVLGNMAGNEMIKKGFVDPDFDYHAYQAARMYGIPYANVSSKLRKAAKGINFGLPYGMGDQSLGVRVFGEESAENTAKAANLRAKYFEGQEDIRDFFDRTRDNGVANGYTETYFGRRRYYHRNKFSIPAIRRQAGNAVIQGSSADIYKLAVGRLFLRICKEGWLGKVLLTGFIHDEVLCEVHCSIDPMKWLKVLREEFEVKIEGWCPLYMGFGFGMSWYEAKKTELPIQLQWELVDKYGETGYPNWHQDGYELCAEVPEILRDFGVRHIISGLLEEDAQGKEIKAALNKSMFEVLVEDKDEYDKIMMPLADESFIIKKDDGTYRVPNEASEIFVKLKKKKELEVKHIAKFHKDEDGLVMFPLPKAKDTQLAIDLYCEIHGVDRSKVNLLSIADVKADENASSSSLVYDLEGDEQDEDNAKRLADTRVDTFGMFLDTENSMVILRMMPESYMAFIKSKTNTAGLGYRIRFKDVDKKMLYDTQCYLDSASVQTVQQMYLSYFKSVSNV